MGMIGRYIDSLTDEQRDRVIEHPDPTYDGGTWRVYDGPRWGCACMVGAAECAPAREEGESVPHYWRRRNVWTDGLKEPAWLAGRRFPELTRRFGARRVWAAVKARAARLNRIPAAAPARETVGAAS